MLIVVICVQEFITDIRLQTSPSIDVVLSAQVASNVMGLDRSSRSNPWSRLGNVHTIPLPL